MDYRRPLFQLEQWSPFLAKKMWGLTSFLEAPFFLALGLKIRTLTDLNSAIEIPLTVYSKNETGEMQSSIVLAAGEYASKILWQRHLQFNVESLKLDSIHCRFLRPIRTRIFARTELSEPDREKILRRLRMGDDVTYEMPVVVLDAKEQNVAGLTCVWNLKSLRPMALPAGSDEGQSL